MNNNKEKQIENIITIRDEIVSLIIEESYRIEKNKALELRELLTNIAVGMIGNSEELTRLKYDTYLRLNEGTLNFETLSYEDLEEVVNAENNELSKVKLLWLLQNRRDITENLKELVENVEIIQRLYDFMLSIALLDGDVNETSIKVMYIMLGEWKDYLDQSLFEDDEIEDSNDGVMFSIDNVKNQQSSIKKEPKKKQSSIGKKTIKDKEIKDKTSLKAVKEFSKLFEYEETSKRIIITSFKGGVTKIEVPNNINGKKVVISQKFTNYVNHEKLKRVKSIFIHDDVIVEKNSFARIKSLIEVRLPNTMTEVYNAMFMRCERLESVKLSKNTKVIGTQAFYFCKNLKEANLPENLTTIKDEAFNGCEVLTGIELPKMLESIGKKAFRDNFELEEIVIPDMVKVIQENTFLQCKNLKSIKLPEQLESIKDSAFSGCYSLKEINIPKSVHEIKSSAFGYCKSLKTMVVPEKINVIGPYLFQGCESLQNVTFLGVINKIDHHAFNGCSSLEKFEIDDSVETLGEYAFYDCISLKSIRLSESIESINGGLLSGCKELTEVYIPKNVKTIKTSAFNRCKKLKTIHINKDQVKLAKLISKEYPKIHIEYYS